VPTLILAWLLFDLKVYGRRHVPKAGGVLIVCNHQSNLDPVLVAVRLDRPLNYIAKSQLFHRRFVRWLLRSLNAFPVRQGTGDVGAVRETIRRLQEGHIINIYPEGRRTPDGNLQALQKGVALIIKRANVPVVPAAIIGAFDAWPIHRRLPRSAPVRIRFAAPLDLASLQSEDEIIGAIDLELRRMFVQMQRRFPPVGVPPGVLLPPVATGE
jgi:1-acyl-sn-glycerol-3-phosphate acyltransferase